MNKPSDLGPDRGMSLAEWQDWIVDLLIKKHDEGLSDNQLRFIFATEFDRRFGKESESRSVKISGSVAGSSIITGSNNRR